MLPAHHDDARADATFRIGRDWAAAMPTARFARSLVEADRVVAELARRALRARATRLVIESDPHAMRLSVIDDGEPIADFGAELFGLTRETFNSNAAMRAHAHGLGPSAALVHSHRLRVASGARELTIDDTLRARGGHGVAAVRAARAVAGSRFDLEGPAALVEPSEIAAMLRGFTLGVSVNGVELERPDALRPGHFEPTAMGWVRLADTAAGASVRDLYGVRLYAEGLRVSSLGMPGASVMHLAPGAIELRAPALHRARAFDLARVRLYLALHQARFGEHARAGGVLPVWDEDEPQEPAACEPAGVGLRWCAGAVG